MTDRYKLWRDAAVVRGSFLTNTDKPMALR